MRMKRLKPVMLLFALMLVISSIFGVQTGITHAETMDHGVTVSATDYEGDNVLPLTAVDFEPGDDAYDVLKKAMEEHDIDLHMSQDDEDTVTSIDIADIELDENAYWHMTVNGEALEEDLVQDGDTVEFEIKESDDDEADKADKTEKPDEKNSDEDNENLRDEKQGNDEGDEPKQEENDTDKPDKEESKNTENDDANPAKTENNNDNPEDKSGAAPFDVQEHIDDLLTFVDDNVTLGYGSEWWIWGLAHTDHTISDSYLNSAKEKINDADGEFRSLNLQRIIIALSLLGEDASDIEGYNLIDILADEEFKTGINGYIYSLIAADSGQYDMSDEFREKVINHILEDEKDGGGWALYGEDPTVDITAMALAALVPYQDQEDVKAATDRAIDYLSDVQEDNGGYYEEFNGGDSSESVSQVIIALSALGINPTSDAFTAKDGNLLEHLIEFKRDDGGYKHLIDDDYTNPMSNQQALLAYVAYDKFLHDEGSVYQPTVVDNGDGDDAEDGDNEDKDKPGNDNEKPENDNEVPNNDKETPEDSDDVSIQPEEESQVTAHQKVTIKDTNTSIKLPSDLPEGTTLTVTDASESKYVSGINGMELAGDVFEFNFSYPKGEQPSEAFTLTMAYDKDKYDADEVAIYYYDEASEEWIQVDGEVNEADGTITFETDHFSTFGVFAKTANGDKNNDPFNGNTNSDDDKNTVAPSNDDNNENKEDNAGDLLPETATNMFNYMLIGFSLLIAGAILFFIKRKQRARA